MVTAFIATEVRTNLSQLGTGWALGNAIIGWNPKLTHGPVH